MPRIPKNRRLRYRPDRRYYRTKLWIEEHTCELGEKYGDRKKKWTNCGEYVMAHVNHLRGKESEMGKRLVASATAEITTPFIPFITRHHRFVSASSGAIYEIKDINDLDSLGIEHVFAVSERPREQNCIYQSEVASID